MQRGKEKLRTDKAIKALFPGLTNRQIDEAIDAGLVVDLQGKKVAKGDKGRDLKVEKLTAHIAKLRAGNPEISLSILEEHEDWLAIDKPAGLPGHPISLFDFVTVTHGVLAKYPLVKEEFTETQPIFTPHRLDTETSGVLIVAKTKAAYERWRELFSQKKLSKKYLAWCWGIADKTEFSNESRLEHDPKDERKMRVGDGDHSLPAASRITVVNQLADKFLCEVTCETGVTHQVRVHLSALGFPLLGDKLYDPDSETRAKKMPFHQLRAVELRGPSLHIKADETDFKNIP